MFRPPDCRKDANVGFVERGVEVQAVFGSDDLDVHLVAASRERRRCNAEPVWSFAFNGDAGLQPGRETGIEL